MKKTISITMAFALVATLSTAAFAAAANDADIKKDIGVNAKYVEDIKTSKTIIVPPERIRSLSLKTEAWRSIALT